MGRKSFADRRYQNVMVSAVLFDACSKNAYRLLVTYEQGSFILFQDLEDIGVWDAHREVFPKLVVSGVTNRIGVVYVFREDNFYFSLSFKPFKVDVYRLRPIIRGVGIREVFTTAVNLFDLPNGFVGFVDGVFSDISKERDYRLSRHLPIMPTVTESIKVGGDGACQ